MKQIWKLVAVITAIVLAGFISFLVWRENQAGKQREAEYTELQNKLRPLEQEKTRIKKALENLEADYAEKSELTASAVILFTDLDEKIYTDMYPKMRNRGYVGVLALPISQLPGQSGCLSQEQFDTLMKAGWKCSLKWEKEMEPEEWFKACEEMMPKIGITRPDMVYFPQNTYKSQSDEFLTEKGIEIVVHHGERGLPLVISEVEDGIWHPGARGLRESKTVQLLEEAVELKGNIIFTVGSDIESENYNQNQFDSMLVWLKKYCDDEQLVVTDLWEARKQRKRAALGSGELEESYEEARERLEDELEVVEGEMEELLRGKE